MKSRTQTFLALLVAGIGLVIAGILGLFAYMSAAATPLYPDPQSVPSVSDSAPLPRWTDAAEQGRGIVRAALTEQNLPGVSVAVGVGGDIVWAEGFGWANLENQVKVEPDTKFRIGTASTVLTSAAVGLLLEQGRLKLDDRIQTHVPQFPEKRWPLTLRQLMAHLAGVRTDSGDESPLFGYHCDRPLEALKIFADQSLWFEPGTQYRYSSYGWILVSAAVEAASGEPFLRFMRRQVFEPLAMENTTADTSTATPDREADPATEPGRDRATAYFPRFAADPRYGPDLNRDVDYSCYAGASVFLSTPSDLVRFAMAINSGKLLRPETVQLLQTSQRLASGQDTGYGLGWDLETANLSGEQTVVIGHNGESMGGRVASLMSFPKQGIVVAVTSNISYAETFALGTKIAQAFVQPAQGPKRN